MNSRGSILVVDDEIGPRESLCMILKPVYDVHAVVNGQEAIKFMSQNRIDLITLDLKMPGLSGIETLQAIKKIQPDIEVIIITGYGSLENAREVLRYGAGDFISKPFNVPDVIITVGKAFERRRYLLKVKSLLQQLKSIPSPPDTQDRLNPLPG